MSEIRTENLNSDLCLLLEYFTRRRLRPNSNKTDVSTFYLNNTQALLSLNVTFCELNVTYNPNRKYLGVIMDKTLFYKTHLCNFAAKMNSRNNIIQKLTGTEWGANFSVLRTFAITLIYLTAEYCAPVWFNSSRVKR